MAPRKQSSYVVGHYTNLLGATALFAIAAIGSLLFDARVVIAAFASFLVLVLLTTLGAQIGMIPYAPMLLAAPIEDGRLETRWLLGGPPGITSLSLAGLAFFFVAVMRRLQRATALISRYIPFQLADKILSGDHTRLRVPNDANLRSSSLTL